MLNNLPLNCTFKNGQNSKLYNAHQNKKQKHQQAGSWGFYSHVYFYFLLPHNIHKEVCSVMNFHKPKHATQHSNQERNVPSTQRAPSCSLPGTTLFECGCEHEESSSDKRGCQEPQHQRPGGGLRPCRAIWGGGQATSHMHRQKPSESSGVAKIEDLLVMCWVPSPRAAPTPTVCFYKKHISLNPKPIWVGERHW